MQRSDQRSINSATRRILVTTHLWSGVFQRLQAQTGCFVINEVSKSLSEFPATPYYAHHAFSSSTLRRYLTPEVTLRHLEARPGKEDEETGLPVRMWVGRSFICMISGCKVWYFSPKMRLEGSLLTFGTSAEQKATNLSTTVHLCAWSNKPHAAVPLRLRNLTVHVHRA